MKTHTTAGIVEVVPQYGEWRPTCYLEYTNGNCLVQKWTRIVENFKGYANNTITEEKWLPIPTQKLVRKKR